jgi:hypothetical protein
MRRDSVWAAPLLWRSEFRHMLSRLLRRREMSFEDAVRIMADVEEAMAGREFIVVSHQVPAPAESTGRLRSLR